MTSYKLQKVNGATALGPTEPLTHTKLDLSAQGAHEPDEKLAIISTDTDILVFLPPKKSGKPATGAWDGRHIGKGAMGTCYMAHAYSSIHPGPPQPRCLKAVDIRHENPNAPEPTKALEKSLRLGLKVDPEGGERLLRTEHVWYMDMPLAAGSVADYMVYLRSLAHKKLAKQPCNALDAHVASLILGAGRGLSRLHDCGDEGYVHDDLKWENLLVRNRRIILADLDRSSELPIDGTMDAARNSSPERQMTTAQQRHYGIEAACEANPSNRLKSDVNSLGRIIALCFDAVIPMSEAKNPKEFMRYFEGIEKRRCRQLPDAPLPDAVRAFFEQVDAIESQFFRDVIYNLLALNPRDRDSLETLLDKVRRKFPFLDPKDGFYDELWDIPDNVLKLQQEHSERLHRATESERVQRLLRMAPKHEQSRATSQQTVHAPTPRRVGASNSDEMKVMARRTDAASPLLFEEDRMGDELMTVSVEAPAVAGSNDAAASERWPIAVWYHNTCEWALDWWERLAFWRHAAIRQAHANLDLRQATLDRRLAVVVAHEAEIVRRSTAADETERLIRARQEALTSREEALSPMDDAISKSEASLKHRYESLSNALSTVGHREEEVQKRRAQLVIDRGALDTEEFNLDGKKKALQRDREQYSRDMTQYRHDHAHLMSAQAALVVAKREKEKQEAELDTQLQRQFDVYKEELEKLKAHYESKKQLYVAETPIDAPSSDDASLSLTRPSQSASKQRKG